MEKRAIFRGEDVWKNGYCLCEIFDEFYVSVC